MLGTGENRHCGTTCRAGSTTGTSAIARWKKAHGRCIGSRSTPVSVCRWGVDPREDRESAVVPVPYPVRCKDMQM